MKTRIHLILILAGTLFSSCQAQQTSALVGGPCEGCEAVYEYGDIVLTNVDTLPDFQLNEPKLKITGTVFQNDQKTPASDVIIYIYHTNRAGKYISKGTSQNWERRHGYIRGWVKTKEDGKYTFYTFRPGAYPGGSEPEHIHITVKEPNKNEYYLDEYVFDDDPLLTQRERTDLQNRGGSGIVIPVQSKGSYIIERDLILGQNVPNYR